MPQSKEANKNNDEKRFLVRIPKDMHYSLKLLSLEQNMPMAELVRIALEEFLKNRKRGNKKA